MSQGGDRTGSAACPYVTEAEDNEVSSRLFAYAFLRAMVRDGSANPIEVLKPIVLRAILERPASRAGAVKLSSVVRNIDERIGLTIPVSVCEFVARRLVVERKAKYDKTTDGYFGLVEMPLTAKTSEDVARRKYQTVLENVQRVLIDSELDPGEAEKVIGEWLDESALSLLGGTARAYNASQSDYRTNRIIFQSMKRFGDPFVEALADIALGDAIFRAISELTQYDSEDELELATSSKLPITALFDTPIVMAYFGFSRASRVTSAREVVRMCRQLGVVPGVYSITLEEMGRVFLGAARNMQSNRPVTGEIREYIFEESLTSSDLLERLRRLRALVKENFRIIDPPRVSNSFDDHDFSELELDKKLEERVKQRYEDAKKHDVDALVATYRLRGGTPRKVLEKADFIFVTSNKNVADSSTSFFQEHFRERGERNVVQICMHSPVFASRLWTKLPTVDAQLPRSQVIAQILSLIRPNPSLKQSFMEELGKLAAAGAISDESRALVEFSHFTDELLSEQFEYEAISISEHDTRSVINGVISKIADWKERKAEEVRRGFSEEYQDLEREVQAAQDLLKGSAEDYEDARGRAQDLSKALEEKQAQLERIERRVEWVSSFFYYLILIVVVAVILIHAFFAYFWDKEGSVLGDVVGVAVSASLLLLTLTSERLLGLRTRLIRVLKKWIK